MVPVLILLALQYNIALYCKKGGSFCEKPPPRNRLINAILERSKSISLMLVHAIFDINQRHENQVKLVV